MTYSTIPAKRPDLVKAVGCESPRSMEVCNEIDKLRVNMECLSRATSPGDFEEIEGDQVRKWVEKIRNAFPDLKDEHFRLDVSEQWNGNYPVLILTAYAKMPGNPRQETLPKWIRDMQGPSTEGNAIRDYIFDTTATLDDLHRAIVDGLKADRELARKMLAQYKANHPKKTK